MAEHWPESIAMDDLYRWRVQLKIVVVSLLAGCLLSCGGGRGRHGAAFDACAVLDTSAVQRVLGGPVRNAGLPVSAAAVTRGVTVWQCGWDLVAGGESVTVNAWLAPSGSTIYRGMLGQVGSSSEVAAIRRATLTGVPEGTLVQADTVYFIDGGVLIAVEGPGNGLTDPTGRISQALRLSLRQMSPGSWRLVGSDEAQTRGPGRSVTAWTWRPRGLSTWGAHTGNSGRGLVWRYGRRRAVSSPAMTRARMASRVTVRPGSTILYTEPAVVFTAK